MHHVVVCVSLCLYACVNVCMCVYKSVHVRECAYGCVCAKYGISASLLGQNTRGSLICGDPGAGSQRLRHWHRRGRITLSPLPPPNARPDGQGSQPLLRELVP